VETIASRIYSRELQHRFVFLSASFPTIERRRSYFPTVYPFEVTGASTAAARAIFGASGKLIFGGHPTISPLILSVGSDFLPDIPDTYRPFVRIYQSEFFKGELSDETLQHVREGIGEIIWVPAVGGDRERSLLRMRTEMLEMRPIAGVFIGGMEGVYAEGAAESEFALFKKLRPYWPIYPI